MAQVTIGSGLTIEYETFGSPDDDAVVLVSGFSAQLTMWRPGFCEMLASRGRYVIRFDNRDCGLSSKIDGAKVDVEAVLGAAMAGTPMPPVPYTLTDMAADVVGLMDALDIDRAHVAGASMGGMIVQVLAIEHPDRLLSVTSIMSTIGDLAYGQALPEAMGVLMAPPPTTREEAIEFGYRTAVWSSKRYFDGDTIAEHIATSFDRASYPEGGPRQLAAIYATGDRSAQLAEVDVPFLVIHGLDDTLIAPTGGRRTAELVPGAHLLEVADMGHDTPEPLWPLITGAMLGHQDVAVQVGSAA